MCQVSKFVFWPNLSGEPLENSDLLLCDSWLVCFISSLAVSLVGPVTDNTSLPFDVLHEDIQTRRQAGIPF